ncbi:MAG TPA: adenylate/guanylate cyclase domain-containing protein [Candidatus Binataceae bacterium]|nr:adenylate/guanylate cyclase domain-containing protein [Candidatus Binataceae bacterium]
MSETATRRREIAPITASNTGERRHLTVLFCDLVGSTEIAARLDPEEWREVVASYHRTATEAITQFGGYVAQYLGDGVMAYFGWPEAYDNNAERAVRAGLAIMDAMPDLNEESKVPTLHARVGIDSGAVVVGEGAARSAGVFGDAPNIAARVQAVAEPGGVLITDAVHRLISGLFVVQDRGTVQLKGIERPLQLYNVVGPSTVRGRLEATALSRGLTSFVGRDDELRLLRNRWERVLDGEGQVVLIVGEAGIGKSRLVRRFHEQMLGVAHTWVETSAAAFYQNTPFYLISEMSRGLAGCNRDQAPDKQLAQLVKALESAGVKPAEAIPLIAPLLSLPIPSTYPPPVLSPEQQRRRLFAILVEWVLGAAKGRPIVITTEDLHWADPSSLESIQLLMEQRAGARLLLICTARPEFRGQWPLQAHHTQVTLNRLSTQNVRSMVLQVVAHAALSDETLSAVVERTGGVPLFVEELTRAVLERGATKSVGREIPVTLHDSLMARLDRLGPAKEIMQLAAVIGSEFSYRLLHAVHPVADEDLRHDLRRLTDAELLYVRGIPPDATYQFKHALIRDAAYDALLKSRRRDLHRVVARTISEHFASLREAHPEVLARHWTEAGEAELAITEWSRAGKTVQARHAFNEARENYEQALALVDLLPESPERDLRELEIRQSIVQLLHLTKGYSAPDSIDATRRAVTLAQKSGNLRQLLNLLIAKGVNALSLGDLAAAGDLADQAMELALRDGASSSFFGRMRSLQMMVCYYRGDLAGVERHFTAGLKFFEDPSFRQVPGAGAITFGFASWNAWTLGRADSAREREAKMMAIANKDSPFEMAFLRFLVARMRIWAREYDEAESSAAGGVELSEEHRFPWLAALSRAALGHAMAKLGRASEGVTLIRQGMAGLVDTGSRFGVTNVIASLAEAYTCNGAVGDALEAAEKALQANPEEVVFRPCILQLRGELRLKQGLIDLAKSDLRDSIALSRKIGATAWELRATTSLSRLLASQKHQQEARSALAEIHNRITEGFDTADLKDARILLQELSILAF